VLDLRRHNFTNTSCKVTFILMELLTHPVVSYLLTHDLSMMTHVTRYKKQVWFWKLIF